MPFFKVLISLINAPRFILHFLCWYLMGGAKFYEDIKVNIRMWHYDCHVFLAFLYLMTFDKLFRNLFYYRIGKLKYFISWLAPAHNSFVIGTYSKIGKGFLCLHPIGTYVNAKSIGDYFIIKNNTVIGANERGIPVIGNNVEIGVNCVILGDIVIGNNVVIGAGTVLTKSVPDNSVVVGNPAYILKQDGKRVNKPL